MSVSETSPQAPDAASDAFLRVEDLRVEFPGRRRLFRPTPPPVRAVNGVSFEIKRASTFGLVGESGSGKSTIARALLQLERPSGGRVILDGEDVTRVPPGRTLGFRKKVQAVLQDPLSSLNPSHDVSVIVGDGITLHQGVSKGKERDRRVIELLSLAGLGAEYLHRYPYQMSGGQRQRVSIARALAVKPNLIIADEPTSALDVSVQSQVINLLVDIQKTEQLALLFIAHDLDVVRHVSHDVGVMYLGYLVESGAAEELYREPCHPYTEMLVASSPVPDPSAQAKRREYRRRASIDAEPPSPANLPVGCPFANRCPLAFEPCFAEMPKPTQTHHGGWVRCHLHTDGPALGGASVAPLIASSSHSSHEGRLVDTSRH
ncbi:MAG: ABC transporter ATP-binding protein [Acidimicrobiaceae bacterium]|nr:ABC transporter ATP-binding protein [Acidimicrobiaceae bacterium]